MEQYPLEPLLARWRSRNPDHLVRDCGCAIGGECGSLEALARRVGVSHSTMHRRLTAGWLNELEADTWACRIGDLPHMIWPTYGKALHEPESITNGTT